ncbi:TPA: hypothetical protein DCE37_26780 [Candidatus Latescibacteria bacterium]|nr:hypothetical protein [Candidatus Latescibacterota bacterium]|tara:strand:+ start:347 stop:925 length:579 start_codon:yes stop_codon:yes gene_type:complete
MDWHPFIVHFPIASIVLSALFDWLSRIDRLLHLQTTGFALLIVGALSTIPAAFTGESAAETAQSIEGIQDAITEHENLSTITLWSAILLAVARIHLVVKNLYMGGRRLAHTVLLTACAVMVIWSAYTGSSLVHEFGAGTQKQQIRRDSCKWENPLPLAVESLPRTGSGDRFATTGSKPGEGLSSQVAFTESH